MSDLRWKLVELWDDLHHSHRRRTLRRSLCVFGLHWPISFWNVSDSFEPPDYAWACEMCGRERLPYRAVLWPIRDLLVRFRIWLDERRERVA